jgi:hypothetical protein
VDIWLKSDQADKFRKKKFKFCFLTTNWWVVMLGGGRVVGMNIRREEVGDEVERKS